MKKVDIGVSIGLIALSTAIYFMANTYQRISVFGYGPDFFPKVLSVLLCVCAVIQLIRALMGKSLQPKEYIDKKGFLRMLCAIGICIVYLKLMQIIGFAIATVLFVFSLMALLRQVGMKKRILICVILSLTVWAIFRYFLLIPIPTGIFSFTF